jgi:hypothetical protein
METDMKVNGKMTKYMDKDISLEKIKNTIMENGLKIIFMAMEHLYNPMETYMKDNGI